MPLRAGIMERKDDRQGAGGVYGSDLFCGVYGAGHGRWQ